MLAAQEQPLRNPISRGQQHPRAQDAQVPVLGADPIPCEFDLVDSNIVLSPGEIAKQVNGNRSGITEVGTAKVSWQVVLAQPPLRNSELSQVYRYGLGKILRKQVDVIELRRIRILDSRESWIKI